MVVAVGPGATGVRYVMNVVTTVGVGPATLMVVVRTLVVIGLSPTGSLASAATHCEYHSLGVGVSDVVPAYGCTSSTWSTHTWFHRSRNRSLWDMQRDQTSSCRRLCCGACQQCTVVGKLGVVRMSLTLSIETLYRLVGNYCRSSPLA